MDTPTHTHPHPLIYAFTHVVIFCPQGYSQLSEICVVTEEQIRVFVS